MSWVEKNRKINNRGGEGRWGRWGDDYSGLESTNQGKCCYKLGQLLQIRATFISKWDSYYQLGQNVLQIGTVITNQGNYYKLGHNSNSLIKNLTPFEDDAEICLLNFLMQSICKQPVDGFIKMASLKIDFSFFSQVFFQVFN